MAQHSTWTGRTLGEPTAEQWAALQRFSTAYGRTWKQTLRDAWMDGNYPCNEDDASLLQQLRNQFGPRWLMLVDITKGR